MKAVLFVILFLVFSQESGWNENVLYGEWQWLYSEGGFMGNRITPDDTKSAKKIVLTKDHVLIYYTDDSLVTRRNYQVQLEKTAFSKTLQPVLHLSGTNKTQTVALSGNDTLKLKDNSYDGYEHGYVRVK